MLWYRHQELRHQISLSKLSVPSLKTCIISSFRAPYYVLTVRPRQQAVELTQHIDASHYFPVDVKTEKSQYLGNPECVKYIRYNGPTAPGIHSCYFNCPKVNVSTALSSALHVAVLQCKRSFAQYNLSSARWCAYH